MLQEVRGNISLFLKKYEVPLYLPEQHIAELVRKCKIRFGKETQQNIHNIVLSALAYTRPIDSLPAYSSSNADRFRQ
jgi:hypothetical protein